MRTIIRFATWTTCVVGAFLFLFMFFKVPVVGVYKFTGATFGLFKAAWVIIFAVLTLNHAFEKYREDNQPASA